MKSEQLQIRLTPAQKAALKTRARRAGQDVSSYVLARVLPEVEGRFEAIVAELGGSRAVGLGLAALNDLLVECSASELSLLGEPRLDGLSVETRCYVAGMIEQACALKACKAPAWVSQIPPLERPYFGSSLKAHRMHLLRVSPVAFRRRNIFIDSTIGDRV